MSAAGGDWRPPGSLDPGELTDEALVESMPVESEPVTQGDSGPEPPSPSRPAPSDPADLLRRATLQGPRPSARVEEDDPALWDDPASRRELRLLTRLGLATLVLAPLVLPYVILDGFDRWRSLWVTVWILSAILLGTSLGLFVYGFFATLRRRARIVLVLGIVLGPLVYGAWAAVLLARIRRAAALAQTSGSRTCT